MANPVNTFAKFMLDTMSKTAQTTYADILNTRAREDSQAHDLQRQKLGAEYNIEQLKTQYGLQDEARQKQIAERTNKIMKTFGVNTLDELRNGLSGPQRIAVMEYIQGGANIDERLFATAPPPPPEIDYNNVGTGRFPISSGGGSWKTGNYAVDVNAGLGLSKDHEDAMGKVIAKLRSQPTNTILEREFNKAFKERGLDEVNFGNEDIRINELDPTSGRKETGGTLYKKIEEVLNVHGYNPVGASSYNVAEGDDAATSFGKLAAALGSNYDSIVKIVNDRNNLGGVEWLRGQGEITEFDWAGLDTKIKTAQEAVDKFNEFMEVYNTGNDASKAGFGNSKRQLAQAASDAIEDVLGGGLIPAIEVMERVAESGGSIKKDSQTHLLIEDIKEGVTNTKSLITSIEEDSKGWMGFADYVKVINAFRDQIGVIANQ